MQNPEDTEALANKLAVFYHCYALQRGVGAKNKISWSIEEDTTIIDAAMHGQGAKTIADSLSEKSYDQTRNRLESIKFGLIRFMHENNTLSAVQAARVPAELFTKHLPEFMQHHGGYVDQYIANTLTRISGGNADGATSTLTISESEKTELQVYFDHLAAQHLTSAR